MGQEAFLAAQILDFAESTDDRVAALLQAGTGITLTYNDGAGTLTIANTGLGGSTGSTDNRILRADGTGGATVQNSAVTIDDSGNISGLGTINCGAITASGTSTINSLPAGGGLVLVPSATYNAFYGLRLASSSAGTERAAFLIQPFSGEIMIGANNGGGYYPVIYSNGVARLTFGTSGSLTARYGSTVNDTVALSDVGTLAGQTNAEGTKWQLVTASGADSLRLASTSFVGFNSTGNLNTGSIDASIRRNTSGPTLDTWSAGGLRVRNADGSAAGALDCGAITASGLVTCQSGVVLASRTKAAVLASSTAVNSGRFQLSDAGLVGREVYPDGTNWRHAADDSIVT